VASSPAVSDGVVYVGTGDHTLYSFALDGGNNAVYRRSATPPSYASLHPDYRLKPAN
jgi:outer membrane protein assembly factor BamB